MTSIASRQYTKLNTFGDFPLSTEAKHLGLTEGERDLLTRAFRSGDHPLIELAEQYLNTFATWCAYRGEPGSSISGFTDTDIQNQLRSILNQTAAQIEARITLVCPPPPLISIDALINQVAPTGHHDVRDLEPSDPFPIPRPGELTPSQLRTLDLSTESLHPSAKIKHCVGKIVSGSTLIGRRLFVTDLRIALDSDLSTMQLETFLTLVARRAGATDAVKRRLTKQKKIDQFGSEKADCADYQVRSKDGKLPLPYGCEIVAFEGPYGSVGWRTIDGLYRVSTDGDYRVRVRKNPLQHVLPEALRDAALSMLPRLRWPLDSSVVEQLQNADISAVAAIFDEIGIDYLSSTQAEKMFRRVGDVAHPLLASFRSGDCRQLAFLLSSLATHANLLAPIAVGPCCWVGEGPKILYPGHAYNVSVEPRSTTSCDLTARVRRRVELKPQALERARERFSKSHGNSPVMYSEAVSVGRALRERGLIESKSRGPHHNLQDEARQPSQNERAIKALLRNFPRKFARAARAAATTRIYPASVVALYRAFLPYHESREAQHGEMGRALDAIDNLVGATVRGHALEPAGKTKLLVECLRPLNASFYPDWSPSLVDRSVVASWVSLLRSVSELPDKARNDVFSFVLRTVVESRRFHLHGMKGVEAICDSLSDFLDRSDVALDHETSRWALARLGFLLSCDTNHAALRLYRSIINRPDFGVIEGLAVALFPQRHGGQARRSTLLAIPEFQPYLNGSELDPQLRNVLQREFSDRLFPSKPGSKDSIAPWELFAAEQCLGGAARLSLAPLREQLISRFLPALRGRLVLREHGPVARFLLTSNFPDKDGILAASREIDLLRQRGAFDLQLLKDYQPEHPQHHATQFVRFDLTESTLEVDDRYSGAFIDKNGKRWQITDENLSATLGAFCGDLGPPFSELHVRLSSLGSNPFTTSPIGEFLTALPSLKEALLAGVSSLKPKQLDWLCARVAQYLLLHSGVDATLFACWADTVLAQLPTESFDNDALPQFAQLGFRTPKSRISPEIAQLILFRKWLLHRYYKGNPYMDSVTRVRETASAPEDPKALLKGLSGEPREARIVKAALSRIFEPTKTDATLFTDARKLALRSVSGLRFDVGRRSCSGTEEGGRTLLPTRGFADSARPYTPGDPAHSIDWRREARGEGLRTKLAFSASLPRDADRTFYAISFPCLIADTPSTSRARAVAALAAAFADALEGRTVLVAIVGTEVSFGPPRPLTAHPADAQGWQEVAEVLTRIVAATENESNRRNIANLASSYRGLFGLCPKDLFSTCEAISLIANRDRGQLGFSQVPLNLRRSIFVRTAEEVSSYFSRFT